MSMQSSLPPATPRTFARRSRESRCERANPAVIADIPSHARCLTTKNRRHGSDTASLGFSPRGAEHSVRCCPSVVCFFCACRSGRRKPDSRRTVPRRFPCRPMYRTIVLWVKMFGTCQNKSKSWQQSAGAASDTQLAEGGRREGPSRRSPRSTTKRRPLAVTTREPLALRLRLGGACKGEPWSASAWTPNGKPRRDFSGKSAAREVDGRASTGQTAQGEKTSDPSPRVDSNIDRRRSRYRCLAQK